MEWTPFCEQYSRKKYIVKLIFYLLLDSWWQVKNVVAHVAIGMTFHLILALI